MTAPGQLTSPAQSSALYQVVRFADVPGWDLDDQSAAWTAFHQSCPAVIARSREARAAAGADNANVLATVCASALQRPAKLDAMAARAFFEQNFVPHRVVGSASPGLLTAYYEPIVNGSRTPQPGLTVPLHRRPPDLVNLVEEASRATSDGTLTHARSQDGTLVPYATRQQIDEGALAGQGLELFYVADAVDRFFLQVQGSGIIALPAGEQVRIGYDGKNGHPYTSVGRHLIDNGALSADQMSLETLASWLRENPERGQRAIWQNKSYVFFRELPAAIAPEGVLGVALTPSRSLAVDPAFHQLGLPIFVDAPSLMHITGQPFRQLMIAQDVGSAIKGPERGDIYSGSGPDAGKIAGITKHPGRFYVLLPTGVQSNTERQ